MHQLELYNTKSELEIFDEMIYIRCKLMTKLKSLYLRPNTGAA